MRQEFLSCRVTPICWLSSFYERCRVNANPRHTSPLHLEASRLAATIVMLSLSTIRHGSRARAVKDGCLRRLLNGTSTASGIAIGSPRAVSATLAIRQKILSCKATTLTNRMISKLIQLNKNQTLGSHLAPMICRASCQRHHG